MDPSVRTMDDVRKALELIKLAMDDVVVQVETPPDVYSRLDEIEGGAGDVFGPASSTDNAIVRWNGTTGKLIQDGASSGANAPTIADNGDILLATNRDVQFRNSQARINSPASAEMDITALTQIDLQTNDLLVSSSTGAVVLQVTRTGSGSGVNNLLLTNAIAGSPATIPITAQGSSTDININLVPKGAGDLQLGGVASTGTGGLARAISPAFTTPNIGAATATSVTGLSSPVGGSDAANKDYVDSLANGLDWKLSVRVATTVAGTLATSFENGDTVDGVVLATGDRILIKDQAAGAENGIYVVAASGAPARASDANVSAEVTAGMSCLVSEGTANADKVFVLTTNDPITLGVTALVFTASFSGIPDGSVTLAKLADLAQDQFIGRVTASTGVPETATITAAARTVLDDTTTAAMLTTLGALPLAGGTMSGNITLGENAALALDPAGSADGKYTGITVTATAGYTQAFGDLVYLDPTDSRWELCDANAAAAADGDSRGMIGMVVVAGTDGNACTILLIGAIRADAKFPTFTINNPVYVSETAGAVTQTQPTTTDVVIRVVGFALTADEMYFNPSRDYITHV